MSLFDHHDGSVHQLAERDGHSRQRHDIGADAHHAERNEREQHRDRHGDDRDGRAGEVPQKNQDDEHDRDQDLDDRLLHSADRLVDQLRTVVDGNELHPRRKPRLDLFDLGLHPVDYVQSVRAVAHDDDTGDDVARAIQIGDAAPQVGPHRHLANVLDADLRTVVGDAQRDVLEILERARVTAAANHVLRAAEFKQSSAGLLVAAAYRLHHAAHRDAVRPQTVRVEVHLVLARVTADWRNLGHARHRPEVITQVPILIRAQIGEAVLARGVHQGVLIYPPQTRGIGAELGCHPFRQTGEHAGEILRRSRARPVQIGSILKDDVHVGVAEIGEAPHRLDPRRAEHGGDDRIRDLVLDDIRTAVPA